MSGDRETLGTQVGNRIKARWPSVDIAPTDDGVSMTVTPPLNHERKASKALRRAKRVRTHSTKTLKDMNIIYAIKSAALATGVVATGRSGYWAVEKAATEWSNGNRSVAYAEAATLATSVAAKPLYRGVKTHLVKGAALFGEHIAAARLKHVDTKAGKIVDKHPLAAAGRNPGHKE